MSEMIESVAVPFVTIGNRRGLTYQQVTEEPWLMDFVRAFPDSFEVGIEYDCLLFIEPTLDSSSNTTKPPQS